MSRFHQQLKQRQATQTEVDRTKEQLGQQAAIADGIHLPPVGSVLMWAGSDYPSDTRFLFCDGAMYAVGDYPELYQIIGNDFDWHWQATDPGMFRVPDFRDRSPVGYGAGFTTTGTSLTQRLNGEMFGVEDVFLTLTQIPTHNHGGVTGAGGSHDHGGATGSDGAHTHTTYATKNADYVRTGGFDALNALAGTSGGQTGSTNSAGNHTHTISASSTHTHTIPSVGSDGSHTNLQPNLAIGFIIRAKL